MDNAMIEIMHEYADAHYMTYNDLVDMLCALMPKEIRTKSYDDEIVAANYFQRYESDMRSLEGVQRDERMSYEEFLNQCIACGGDLGRMLLTGIKSVFPESYDAVEEYYYSIHNDSGGIRKFVFLCHWLRLHKVFVEPELKLVNYAIEHDRTYENLVSTICKDAPNELRDIHKDAVALAAAHFDTWKDKQN